MSPPGGKAHRGGGMDARGLERLWAVEVGQHTRQPAGEHGLACSGGTHEQQVMPAGGRHLEHLACERLPVHLGEVDAGVVVVGGGLDGREVGPRLLTTERGDQRGKVLGAAHHVAPDQLCLDGGTHRDDDRVGGERVDQREDTWHHAQRAVETELTDEADVSPPGRR